MTATLDNRHSSREERIERILELPPMIEGVGHKIVGMRGERRTLERQIEGLEASIRVATMGRDEYQRLKNQADRDAHLRLALEQSEAWQAKQSRLESLTAGIEKAVVERDALSDERKALKAALESEYADIIERALSDRALAEVIARHGASIA
jgi:DNA repair exonuclease SbcCD ATPase subunit